MTAENKIDENGYPLFEGVENLRSKLASEMHEAIKDTADRLRNFDDMGPWGEGWQSQELIALIATLDKFSSLPKHAELTDTYVQTVPDKCDRIV